MLAEFELFDSMLAQFERPLLALLDAMLMLGTFRSALAVRELSKTFILKVRTHKAHENHLFSCDVQGIVEA